MYQVRMSLDTCFQGSVLVAFPLSAQSGSVKCKEGKLVLLEPLTAYNILQERMGGWVAEQEHFVAVLAWHSYVGTHIL